MKKLLLILMTLAMAAHAHPRSDAELKALISDGTWTWDSDKHSITFGYRPDGVLLRDGVDGMKWDIKDGVLSDIDTAETEGVPQDQWLGKYGGYWHNYTILFLTKHELLIWDKKYKVYTFMYR